MNITELRGLREKLEEVIESLGRADTSPVDVRDAVTEVEKQITRSINQYLIDAGAVKALDNYSHGLYNLEDLCSVIHGIVEGMQ